MKLCIIIQLCSLFTLSLFAQKQSDYIVKASQDTVFVKAIKMDRHMKQISCDEDGRKIKYNAKQLLGLKKDTTFYETGFVRLRTFRSRRYRFLELKVKGNLSLYETDACRGSWTLTGWAKHRSKPVFFYKKQNEPRKDFSRHWKKKTKDCTLLSDRMNSNSPLVTPKEIAQFYNALCAKR